MFNVRLAGDHVYGKWLFTWMSLVMSLIVSHFVLSLSLEMSWMRSGTELSQFLGIFLPTLLFDSLKYFPNILQKSILPGKSERKITA